jgi:hypothetical protein
LPASLIETPDDHQVLATVEEIMLKLCQFPEGDDVDPLSTSLPGRSRVQTLPGGLLRVV